MLIACPYCGPRDLSEFTYQGDATRTRPDPASTDQAAWNAYVYDRVNTAGDHAEFWQHSANFYRNKEEEEADQWDGTQGRKLKGPSINVQKKF